MTLQGNDPIMISSTRESNEMNFKAGTTYKSRFISDADSTFEVRVIKVTAKTVTFAHPHTGEPTRAKVMNHDGVDFFFPMGRYSMAPVIKASRAT